MTSCSDKAWCNDNAPDDDQPPPGFGTWHDAEALRQWSFLRRTPQQRLDWLVAALTLRYEAAALRDKGRAAPR